MTSRLNPLVLLLMASLIAAGSAAAEQCRPDCTHETKACVCAIDGRSATVTAMGGMDRQPLQLGRALEPGDELASADPNAVVAITCPRGSSVLLNGRFRSLILPGVDGQDCALSLLAGSADVQSSQPTSVSAGTTLMGSKRTTYRMQVSSNATVACLVFEGEVEVRNLGTGVVRPLTTLTQASWRSGALQHYGTPIESAELSATARVYARGDLARARALGYVAASAATARREMEQRHAAVLTSPRDQSARIALAAAQAQMRLARPALYQLDLAETLGPTPPTDAAVVAATRWVAYKQIGRESEAAREAEKLRTLDPKRYEVIREIEARRPPP